MFFCLFALFFNFFGMTHSFCSLPGQFILEENEKRVEISAGGWVHVEGGTDNRKVRSEAISLLLPPSCLQHKSQDSMLLNT
jgi:hypothetical protein